MKRAYVSVVAILLLLTLFACSARNSVDVSSMLGANDQKLVQEKGDGEKTSYTFNGNDKVMQRSYDEICFGLESNVEYFYSDEQYVSQIVVTFKSADEKEVISAISNELSKPYKNQEETPDFEMSVCWIKSGCEYELKRVPSGPIYLLIQEKK